MRRDKGAEKDNSIWGNYEREKKLEEEKLWAEKKEAEKRQRMTLYERDQERNRKDRRKQKLIAFAVIALVLAFTVISICLRAPRRIHREMWEESRPKETYPSGWKSGNGD